MKNHKLFATLLVLAFVIGVGCKVTHLTGEEARESLDESAVASQAEALTAASIEISTSFTIGEAVERAADELRGFVGSQLPCAEIALERAKLTIEYGVRDGNCEYRGHEFSGMHTIEVERNDDEVVVQHAWDGMSNGRVAITGEATVTWSRSAKSRHVVHELTWTRLSDGRMAVGSGDRVQTALPEGLDVGFEVSGSRAWEGERGRWELEIDAVQMRWADPVPEAGSYVLHTPFDKTLTLEFDRIDDDSIGVTASSGDRSVSLEITRSGIISRK
jgi:hypothetical protein